MKPSLTGVVGIGVWGLSSALTGCAGPDATTRLPLPNNTALYAPVVQPAGRVDPSPTGSGVAQVSATVAPTPPPGTGGEAAPPGPTPLPAAGESRTFGPAEAVRFALENNPALQAVREQRGFARGGLVFAQTYQYNPIAQFQVFGASGLPGAVLNAVPQAHKIVMDIEVRHQRRFRVQAATAAATRTEWDIAAQELLVAVAADRAFNAVLYRQRKLDVLNETIKLNERTVDQVKKLVDLGRLRPADLILARTELDAAGAQLGQGGTAVAFARSDLRRQFGTLDDSFAAAGDLDLPVPTTDPAVLTAAALEVRPDLQSRRVAVAEAQARLRLQEADRYGNPNFGPAYDYNESRVNFIGFQVGGPIPMFNTRRGEIIQARATFAQAVATVRQFEVQSAQDVQAALARLTQARKWADRYTTKVLPNLLRAVEDVNKLLDQNEPGVDVLKVIGVQRNYLAAYSAYLDALYEVSQARADLAAAVGDPALAVGLYEPAGPPPGPTPPARLPAPAPAKDKP